MVPNKSIVFSVVVIALLVGMACNSSREDSRVLRIAYVMAPGGASHEAGLKIAELVEKYSGGKIAGRVYPNGVLGNDRILVEGLKLGSQDMVIIGTSAIGWYLPEYEFFEAPFLFRDYKHLDSVLYGDIGKEMEQRIYEKSGIHFLGYFHRGSRYLTTTNTVVRSPDDLKGLKMRVPELPVYIKSWEIFGANPTPIAYSDMFMALKQGVADGQENPLEVIYTSHLYETQAYVMNTRHMVGFYEVAVGDRYFKKYTPEEQAIIERAIHEATDFQNKLVDEYEAVYQAKLEESGVQFIDVDREAFEKLAKEKLPVEFSESWELNVFERIIQYK